MCSDGTKPPCFNALFTCFSFLIILCLKFPEVEANMNLYLSTTEVKKLTGLSSEIYYAREGIVNDYALSFTVPIPENIDYIDFTWESITNKPVLYNLALWKNETTSTGAMGFPTVNISHTGEVPLETETFRMTLPCTGSVSAEVEVTLNINVTSPVSRRPPSVIKYKCNKVCIEGVAAKVYYTAPQETSNSEGESDTGVEHILVPVAAGVGLVIILLSIGAVVTRCVVKKNKRDEAFYTRNDIEHMKNSGITVASSLIRPQSPPKPTFILPSSLTLNSYASLRKFSVMTPGSSIHGHQIAHEQNGYHTSFSSRNGTIDGSIKNKIADNDETCLSSSSLSRSEILVDPTSAEIQERFKHVHVERQRIRLTSVLYEGGFGRVYRGCIQKEKPEQDQQVIIKTIVDASPAEEGVCLCRDGTQLHNLYHVNILTMIGISFSDNSPPFLIYPFHNYNNLKYYLQQHRGGHLRAAELVELAVQAAQGLAFLHGSNILHGDIAARNCVVSDKLQLRITDSALSKDLFRDDYEVLGTTGLRPLKWMSCEAIMNSVISTACDVWSYGVLLWELTTLAQQPYVEVASCEMLEYLRDGYRLVQPNNCPDDLYQVMVYCWAIKPQERPKAPLILDYLAAFSKQLDSFI